MAVELSEYFDEAVSLFETARTEVQFRNAISRGYYGVYYMALQVADRGAVIPLGSLSGSTHKKLSDFFGENLNANKDLRLKMRSIGIRLRNLHATRCKADYWLDDVISGVDAEAHFKLCNAVIERVNSV